MLRVPDPPLERNHRRRKPPLQRPAIRAQPRLQGHHRPAGHDHLHVGLALPLADAGWLSQDSAASALRGEGSAGAPGRHPGQLRGLLLQARRDWRPAEQRGASGGDLGLQAHASGRGLLHEARDQLLQSAGRAGLAGIHQSVLIWGRGEHAQRGRSRKGDRDPAGEAEHAGGPGSQRTAEYRVAQRRLAQRHRRDAGILADRLGAGAGGRALLGGCQGGR